MKKFFAILSIMFVLVTPVFAQYGLEETAGAANLKGESEPTVIVGKFIGAALSLIGIVFFILTLYAGVIWMVARGNEEHAKKAIDTIIAAAIGLIITMSAYAITSFILDAANNSALVGGGGGPALIDRTTACGDTRCSDQQVCSSGVCVDACGRPGSGFNPTGSDDFSCVERSSCDPDNIIPNVCPSDDSWVCCSG